MLQGCCSPAGLGNACTHRAHQDPKAVDADSQCGALGVKPEMQCWRRGGNQETLGSGFGKTSESMGGEMTSVAITTKMSTA